jgi:hypothetical protein
MSEQNELGERLVAMEARQGAAAPSVLEREYLELLKTFMSPADQSKIYAAIAVMYVNAGMQEPSKVALYSREAIGRGIGLIKACQLYLYWGEALEIMRPDAASDAEEMREVLTPYLKGLRLTLERPAARVRPLPAVGKIDHDGPPSPGSEEDRDRHQREAAIRTDIEIENDLARYHGLFVDKCSSLFKKAPRLRAELERWAKELVGDDEVVSEIIRRQKEQS